MRKYREDARLKLETLPPAARQPVLRLLSVAAGSFTELPAEMLEEIKAISIRGVDPQWQIDKLEEILDRWALRH